MATWGNIEKLWPILIKDMVWSKPVTSRVLTFLVLHWFLSRHVHLFASCKFQETPFNVHENQNLLIVSGPKSIPAMLKPQRLFIISFINFLFQYIQNKNLHLEINQMAPWFQKRTFSEIVHLFTITQYWSGVSMVNATHHTCHKLWTEICEIRQIFKWDFMKFCESFTKITLKLPKVVKSLYLYVRSLL